MTYIQSGFAIQTYVIQKIG